MLIASAGRNDTYLPRGGSSISGVWEHKQKRGRSHCDYVYIVVSSWQKRMLASGCHVCVPIPSRGFLFSLRRFRNSAEAATDVYKYLRTILQHNDNDGGERAIERLALGLFCPQSSALFAPFNRSLSHAVRRPLLASSFLSLLRLSTPKHIDID